MTTLDATADREKLSRLRWQCRRGMLELDAILDVFLEHGYKKLSEQHAELFEEILEFPDQLLFDYFFGQSNPTDKDVADVINFIKNTAYHQARSVQEAADIS